MHLTFAYVQRVVAIPTALSLFLATTDLPARGAPLPAAEGTQAPSATQSNQLQALEAQAEKGDPWAMDELGVDYTKGVGVGKDLKLAVSWFTKAANAGYVRGMANLGIMYASGSGVERNDETAIFWWKNAAGAGDSQSMLFLGKAYLDGVGVPADRQQAAEWFQRAANLGDEEAKRLLAEMGPNAPSTANSVPASQPNDQANSQDSAEQQRCDELAGSPSDPSGHGTGVDFDRIDVANAVVACQAAVASSPAQPRYLYEYGRALDAGKRYSEAFQEFSQAAGMGYAAAMFALGQLYRSGDGVEKSDVNATAWYFQAANAGNVAGMNALGAAFFSGAGVQQSDVNAVAWYRKAAEAGEPYAMLNLGQMLRAGRGTQWNEPEAMTWFAKAANLGNAQAEMQLGLGYMNGLGGGVQNYNLAAQWLGKAAQQGNAWAQLNMGILYQNGWGVTQDAGNAKTYYGYAAKSDDQQVAQAASERLQALDKQSSDGALVAVVAGAALLAIIAAASSNNSSSNSSDATNNSGQSGDCKWTWNGKCFSSYIDKEKARCDSGWKQYQRALNQYDYCKGPGANLGCLKPMMGTYMAGCP